MPQIRIKIETAMVDNLREVAQGKKHMKLALTYAS